MSNFAMGTILGKGFPQAQVHTVHSTCAACGKPSPKIVPMAKLHSLLAFALLFLLGIFSNRRKKGIKNSLLKTSQIVVCNIHYV